MREIFKEGLFVGLVCFGFKEVISTVLTILVICSKKQQLSVTIKTNIIISTVHVVSKSQTGFEASLPFIVNIL